LLHATEKYGGDFENRNAAYWSHSHSPGAVPLSRDSFTLRYLRSLSWAGAPNYSSRTAPTGVGSSGGAAALAAFSVAERRVRGVSKLN
jgi:hypothetical protein